MLTSRSPINPRLVYWTQRLAVSVVLSVMLLAAVGTQAHAARVTLEEPAGGNVTGKVRFLAQAHGGVAKRVAFRIDGRRRFLDHRARWKFGRHGVLDTRKLSPGVHRLGVKATFRYGGVRWDSVRVRVRRSESSSSVTTPTTPPSTSSSATWGAGFESGSFSDWSWWGKGDPRYAGHSVVSAREAGIPATEGDRVAQFSVTPSQRSAGNYHSKVMKNWAYAPPESTSWRDDAGRPLERLPNNSLAGTYRASFFLPANYSKSPERWTNIFQFKEAYYDASGQWHQDPQWWLNMSRAGSWGSAAPSGLRSDHPVLHANNWQTDYANYHPKLVAVPLGRWFELKAEVHPGDRIDWYLDGELFDRSSASKYPVGFSKARPTGWVFGIGHYDGIGKLWADKASFNAR